MSAGSSMRRAVEKAQGTFEPRRPARGTTGKVKGPARTLPLRLRPGASRPVPVQTVEAEAPAWRERARAFGRKVAGLFRGRAAKG